MNSPDTDRLPPHSPEAEQGLLGCMMLDPIRALDECLEDGVNELWFYDLRHQKLFSALRDVIENSKPETVLQLALQDYLAAYDLASEVGGIGYWSDFADTVPSAANLPYYLDLLRQKLRLRQLLATCATTTGKIYTTNDPEALFIETERAVLNLTETRTGERERPAREILSAVIDEMERYHRGSARIKALTCGLEYVDKLLCGIGGANGNLFVLSARPGVGKTAWALGLALHAALDYVWFTPQKDADGQVVMDGDSPAWVEHKGLPVAIFSLEMAAPALVERMLFQRARADMQLFRTGFAEKGDFERLTVAAAEINKRAQIWVDDTGRCTIGELKAKARRLARQHGIQLFIIDYIQLMRSDGRRFRDDRVQELAEISGELQNLGKTLGVPFVVLAQMNRDYEKDDNRPPRLSDLKDCGAIEQDADVVAFLSCPRLKSKNEADLEIQDQIERTYAPKPDDKHASQKWSKMPQRVDLLVAKNRFGPTGNCRLLFHRSCTRFEDLTAWQKQRGYKAAAKGERQSSLPTNEEMGL
jgi:replicative DNA helicase